MKKVIFLLTTLVLLNGCAESVALLGSSVGGASSGRVLQSSLNSAISYGVKHKTGKTPIGHMLDYAKEMNPEKKRAFEISEKHTNTDKIKEVILNTKKEFKDVYQFKKSPRELAIVFQSKMKNRE